MRPMEIDYHKPTGLWTVKDEHGVFLAAFMNEKDAEHFARYGAISIFDIYGVKEEQQ